MCISSVDRTSVILLKLRKIVCTTKMESSLYSMKEARSVLVHDKILISSDPQPYSLTTKGYLCCKRRVLEFDEFLKIEGCKRGRHLFAPKKSSKTVRDSIIAISISILTDSVPKDRNNHELPYRSLSNTSECLCLSFC